MQWFCFHQNQLFKCSAFIFSVEKPKVPRVNPWVLVRVRTGVERQKRGGMVAGWWFRTQTLQAWNQSQFCSLKELSLWCTVPLV